MGSCCYTPTKKDFLWWYWLLLVSIVGIPMLLAVLYVAWHPDMDDEAKRRRGERAAGIFWVGTFCAAIALFFIVNVVLGMIYPGETAYGYSFNSWRHNDCFSGWMALAVQFFFATVAANGTNSLVRKRRWQVRIPLFVMCVGLYVVFMALCPVELRFRRPAIHVMQFMVCMLPAHYWGGFKDSPDTGHAWKALWAFLVAASLFFWVSYFGEDFAQLICGVPHAGK